MKTLKLAQKLLRSSFSRTAYDQSSLVMENAKEEIKRILVKIPLDKFWQDANIERTPEAVFSKTLFDISSKYGISVQTLWRQTKRLREWDRFVQRSKGYLQSQHTNSSPNGENSKYSLWFY